jgi:hypothetical protein
MILTITRAKDGGYVTSDDFGRPVGAFEEGETQWGSVECFQRLLYAIVDHFGMTGSKHDARRIRITTGGEDE